MNLDNLRIDQIIQEKEFDNYEKMVDVIGNELIILRSNYVLIEKIDKFPFSSFELSDTNSSSFWSNVFVALFESCINKIWNLIYAKPEDYLTLITLRESTRNIFLKKQYRKAFNEKISSINFESQIEDIMVKVNGLRHNLVSHLQPKFSLSNNIPINKFAINLSELEQIILTADNLFQVLCFKSKGTLLLDFVLSQDGQRNSEIDIIFDLIVKNSHVYNMPNAKSGYWNTYKENLSKSDIDNINKYRKKFGEEEL